MYSYRSLQLATVFVALLATAVPSLAGNITIQLEGRGDVTPNVFGNSGMYLGDDFESPGTHPFNNWYWEKPNVVMTIHEDGDARIVGTQIRDYNNELWDLEMNLTGLKHAGTNTDATFSMDMLDSPSAGYDWEALELTLTYAGSSVVPRENWIGLTMPDIGHVNVAEIRFDDEGRLMFDAWYQHELQTTTKLEWDYEWVWVGPKPWNYEKQWFEVETEVVDKDDQGYAGHKYYNVGDTKAYGWIVPPPPTNVIPTPAALPAGLMLLGLTAMRRRRKTNKS